MNKQKSLPKNNKCENCHEADCKYLEYDEELKKWICDACNDGKKIVEEENNQGRQNKLT